MMQSGSILFRRTLAVLGSAAAMLAAGPSFGQGTATMVGGANAQCAYTGMTVSPNGNIQINCGTVSQTSANFILTGPSSLTVGTNGTAMVSRSGGPAEAITVSYVATGACTASGTGTLSFAQNSASQAITLTPGAAAGTCTLAITPQAGGGHTTAPASGTLSIPVNLAGGGGVPGCPAPQVDYKTVSMGWTGDYVELRMTSGEIAAFPIPAPKPGSSKVTVRLMQGQQPASPASSTTEFYISKCPGVIDPSVQYCYKTTVATNFLVAPDAWTAAKYNYNSQASIGGRGCWAPRAEGQWYVNVRWTFGGSCPYGCGYSMQWSEGSY
jgi:hypothetical protein